MRPDSARGLERREFVKAAVAIGGSSALSACMATERDETTTDEGGVEFPRGDPSILPEGQHRWNDFLVRDAHGNTVLPQHQLLLGLDYEGAAPPTDEHRRQVERAFQTLDEAFRWGTGTREGAAINDGLLYTLGYSQRYFDRVSEAGEVVTPPERVLDAVGEDPDRATGHDALLVLTSDFGSVVLAAEAALFGETDAVNGVSVAASLEGVFTRGSRRTGVVGKGLPAEKLDNDDIPDEAPLSMGYKSGFRDNQPSEDRVTLQDGPFAGGTTQAVSRLRIDLDSWYDQSQDDRAAEMFCPAHGGDDVGETGSRLGGSSGITEDHAESIEEDAAEHGTLGHAQKVAGARDEAFEPRILRRSEGVATDAVDATEFNFSSIQRTVEDFVDARAAMNVSEYDVDVPDERHGIVDYVDTLSRGTYVVVPRSQRALPVVE